MKFDRHRLEAVEVVGIDQNFCATHNRWVTRGRFFSFLDHQEQRQVCIVTEGVVEQLRIGLNCLGRDVLIGDGTFRIVGVMGRPPQLEVVSSTAGPGNEVFVPFSVVYDRHKCLLGSEFIARSPAAVEDAAWELASFLRHNRGIGPGEPDTFSVSPVKAQVDAFERASRLVTAVTVCVAAVSLLVGGMGITNVMLATVADRTREIGLRKALGARSAAIFTQFLTEALLLSTVGALIGLVVASMLIQLMAMLPDMPLDEAAAPGWAMALSLGLAGSVGVAFGAAPALAAARLDPAEALRHE
jgi:putative ABC transport system permease protein